MYIRICTHGISACVRPSQLSTRQLAGDAWDASFRELRQEGASSQTRLSSGEMKGRRAAHSRGFTRTVKRGIESAARTVNMIR